MHFNVAICIYKINQYTAVYAAAWHTIEAEGVL